MSSAVWLLGEKLHAADIPIVGVSDNGNGTFRIDYAPEATPTQISQGNAILAAYNPAADIAAEVQAKLTRIGVIDSLNNELAWLDTTIPTIGAMTAAQVRDVVKRLAQENRGIIQSLIWLARHIDVDS